MRDVRSPFVFAGLALLLAASFVSAQDSGLGPDVRYWPLRDINFPVPIDKIQAMNPRPAKLRFYAGADRSRFKMVAERAITDLDVIDSDRGRKGFRYSSPADGEYDFALQFVYADGDTQPREESLSAQYRIVFDTRPPLVRVAPTGTTGIEWAVEDENVGPDGVQLEVRWQGAAKWTPISPRAFSARDKYNWQGLNPSQPLEVRVVGKDRAGLEMASRIITLPNTGGGPGLPPASGIGRVGFDGAGETGDFPNRPQIDYVNHRSLTVESKLTRVTRSGVKTAHLWVNDGKTGWKKETEQPVSITATTPDPVIRIPYQAAKDGLYGFIMIPVNGAGGKQDDPRLNDPAQFLIEVDTEKPFVKVKTVRVTPGGLAGPRVEIEWDAQDKNLMPDPIVLEYSENPAGPTWKPIATKIPNTGRYVWEVDDKAVWKFYVRARAVDKASNSGEHVYEKEVIVDLEKPQAVIDRVHGGQGGASGPGGASAPPPSSTTGESTPSPFVRESERPITPAAPAPLPKPAPSTPTAPAAPLLPSAPSVPTGNSNSPPPIPSLPSGGY